jgi:hypothetical protein
MRRRWPVLVLAVMALLLWTSPRVPVEAQSISTGPLFNCGLDNIAATLTQCQPAPDPGYRIYVQSIMAQSTTSTAGQFLLRYGTGTNCGTGTTSIFPAGSTVARISNPGFGVVGLWVNFPPPGLALPPAKALCALGVATNTLVINITGTIGP